VREEDTAIGRGLVGGCGVMVGNIVLSSEKLLPIDVLESIKKEVKDEWERIKTKTRYKMQDVARK
jgi:hypothetical protein